MKQASVSPAESEAEVFTENHKVFSYDAFTTACPSFIRANDASEWLRDHGFTNSRLFKPARYPAPLPKGALWYAADITPDEARAWYLAEYHPNI